MNCCPDLIEPYLDEELDAAQRAAVERHVAECLDCAEACTRLREQKAGIRAVATYYQAPPELHRSVREALHRAARSETKPASRELFWRSAAIAASVLLVLSVGWNLAGIRPQASSDSLAESVLSDHLRSLVGTHLVDVVSSDQHTVKPWFAGKLDFSPVVKNLDSEGFVLEGGRIDYLGGRRVAALVYRRRQHIINLFIWPLASSAGGQSRISRNGYNLLQWADGAMTYWAVSDVSPAELGQFRKLQEK